MGGKGFKVEDKRSPEDTEGCEQKRTAQRSLFQMNVSSFIVLFRDL
jgi:hypothetical protein